MKVWYRIDKTDKRRERVAVSQVRMALINSACVDRTGADRLIASAAETGRRLESGFSYFQFAESAVSR